MIPPLTALLELPGIDTEACEETKEERATLVEVKGPVRRRFPA